MNKFKLTIAAIILAMISAACSGPAEEQTKSESDMVDKVVRVTQQQFDNDSMVIGQISLQVFEEVVVCNGYVSSPSNGIAQVSSPISGWINTINCYLGNYVNKGQVLFTIESMELLELQQEFSITASKMNRVKSDYERSKALYNENIGTEKDFIAAESEFRSAQSTYQSLKLRLELLKLNTENIEEGDLYSVFPIIAPISGYITSQLVILGQFAQPQNVLVEIVDVNQLQLQLSVFENDINNLKVGQKVQFTSMGEPDTVHYAVLSSIGKTINNESKTIQCLAKISDEVDANWINRAYVEAKIIVDQTEVKALPNGAFVKSGKDHYVFAVEKTEGTEYFLKKVKVNINRMSKEYTEIVDGADQEKFITNGVYNLRIE